MTSVAATSAPSLSFGGVIRSEWIKLRTVRSTFWCYLILIVLNLLLGLLIASVIKQPTTPLTHDVQQSTWMSTTTLGIAFSELVVAVLGALTVTGEYGTGMIRSTFAAVPRRVPALAAKAIVFAVVTFVVSLVGLLATALVTAPILGGKGITADWGDPNVWIVLLGGAGYLALVGLIAMAIGLILRHSAAGIAAALGLILVVPVIFQLLAALASLDWAADIGVFLPADAGSKMFAYPLAAATTPAATVGSGIVLTNWQGLLVLIAWFAVPYVIGLVLLRRRDA